MILPAVATYQFYGIRLSSLDDILVNREWQVDSRRVLDVKPGNTFPSDHFGVMADLIPVRSDEPVGAWRLAGPGVKGGRCRRSSASWCSHGG